jgi:uncharacterized protein (TIGR02271 family)
MNNQTVVGVFDSNDDARRAVGELQTAGFSREHVDVASRSANSSGNISSDSNHVNSSGTMVEGAADRAAEGVEEGTSAIGRFFRNLFTDDDDTANRYTHVAERSNSIVTVHADSDERAHEAARIMDRMGAVDVDERSAQYGYGSNMNMGSTNMNSNMSTDRMDYDRDRTDNTEQSMKVMEENLEVGKREIETGGARLRSRVVSRPVEEAVRLREERVFVDRQRVDRPATDADFETFKEGTVEMREKAEVPVVRKEARVVEEVRLGKEVTEREETVRDTVRKTEVDVEKFDDDSDTMRRRNDQGSYNPGGTSGPSL